MFRSLTNQNNISLNNLVINMCTNSTTYIMIGLDINHYVATFQGSFPIRVPKINVSFLKNFQVQLWIFVLFN